MFFFTFGDITFLTSYTHSSNIQTFPSSDIGAAENVSMTLTELSVFMKKQELELQLRTEKEREEGEHWLLGIKPVPVNMGIKYKTTDVK